MQIPGDICERPFYLDIKTSQFEDLAKFDLCPTLQESHSLFNALHDLHAFEFKY